jgi:hypothetical protein
MKLQPPSALNERQELVRKRSWPVRSIESVSAILERLREERFMGEIRINVGPGGVPSSVVAEERGKVG